MHLIGGCCMERVKLNLNLDRQNSHSGAISCKGEGNHLALSAAQGGEVNGRDRRGQQQHLG